jgi:hypothetical protein
VARPAIAAGCAKATANGLSEVVTAQTIFDAKSDDEVRSTSRPPSPCSSLRLAKTVGSVIAGTLRQTVTGPLVVAVVAMSTDGAPGGKE